MITLRDKIVSEIPAEHLDAARDQARRTLEIIGDAVRQAAQPWIDQGADPQRALNVATRGLLDRLAVEAPEVFRTYTRAAVLIDDELGNLPA